MMENVKLNLRKKMDNSYEILIGSKLLSKIPAELKKRKLGNKYLIISDSNVNKLYGQRLLSLMKKSGLKCDLVSFKAGEQSKTIETFGKLLQQAQDLGLDRRSAIIALGGGVVGDVAGFVAASYMRGINYIQVPTSLLAMVDSSVGGKVAVDLPTGKNIVGSFYQPKKVFIDVNLLKTLPRKEVLCGLAEMIKHGLIADKKLFVDINNNLDGIKGLEEQVLIKLIKRSCQIKAAVVSKDEKESGLRKMLNYGHTIGHAIETLTGYKKISHGEAIAMGMIVEGAIANELGMLSNDEFILQNSVIINSGLSKKIPKLNKDMIIKELKKDKKVVSGEIEFVLLKGIGKAVFGVKVQNKIIKKALEK